MAACEGSVLLVNNKDTSLLLNDDKWLALQDAKVTIVPKFSNDVPFDFIHEPIGPFVQHKEASVPLWAALEMSRLKQCTILLPEWLDDEELKRMLADEKAQPKILAEVPEHYIEIAFALMKQARAFLGDAKEQTRTELLLREIIELRKKKITASMKDLDVNDEMLDVTNFSAVERTCFRTRSFHVLDTFLRTFRLPASGVAEASETQTETQQESYTTRQQDSAGVGGA